MEADTDAGAVVEMLENAADPAREEPEVEGGVDLALRGEDVDPAAWAAMIEDTTRPKVVLDVRNQYEYDVGHFDGAVRPQGVVCRTRLEP